MACLSLFQYFLLIAASLDLLDGVCVELVIIAKFMLFPTLTKWSNKGEKDWFLLSLPPGLAWKKYWSRFYCLHAIICWMMQFIGLCRTSRKICCSKLMSFFDKGSKFCINAEWRYEFNFDMFQEMFTVNASGTILAVPQMSSFFVMILMKPFWWELTTRFQD